MSANQKSFQVSLPREGNQETFVADMETIGETLRKPTRLKAAALKVLARNQQGNIEETKR